MLYLVRYTHLSKYTGLTSLRNDTITAMMEAKAIRELVISNHHEQQCESPPETLDKGRLKVHPECYKKFTLIIATKNIWIP